jgi:phosphoribosylformylglycinamidine cyclo-ligase
MKRTAYARAGVDICLGRKLKSTLPHLLAAAQRPEVLAGVGGFAGLFDLDAKSYREPVLVASVDGVGTKLRLAIAMNRHDTIGQDLVNHCVNDIAVLGAEPLFFLDHISVGKLNACVFAQLIKGFAKACADNQCALLGGETAELPEFYKPGEYDLSGTIVGVAEKSKLVDGSRIRPGDAVLGLAASGLHTNGYSLARKIFFQQMKLKPSTRVAELGDTIGNELLKVHVSYGPLIRKLLREFDPRGDTAPFSRSARRQGSRPRVIKGLAHITGGGMLDNIPRTLPPDCDVVICKGSWDMLPVFQLLLARSGVAEQELYHVFNMGIGMVVIVPAGSAIRVLEFIGAQKQKAWVIGEVVKGNRRVRV